MPVTEVATRVMIFLSEDDRVAHRGIAEALMNRAREGGMAGATVWRGIDGFGASGHLRNARFPDAALGLPLAIELVDAPERIEGFLRVVRELAPGSFVTRERVQASRFGGTPGPAPRDPGPNAADRS
jgi:uncharacterized protein